jgi:hypothetical protein
MAYISAYEYYENGGASPEDANWGSYQYVPLTDIVNNFELMFTGNHSLVNNEPRHKIIFHAKRTIQELNYDAFKEIKVLELNVCDNLRFVLPPDYVNWVRISLYKDGLLRPLTENIQTNYSKAYLQDNDCRILFDEDGNVLEPEHSSLDYDRITGQKKSIYLNQRSVYHEQEGYCYEGCWYFDYSIGARYGLNTETANANPTFKIDNKSGVINFSSEMGGELCVLEYVSDGMENGNDLSVSVNKLFEDFVYADIEYKFLESKQGAKEYEVRRKRKKRKALWNNAKIRMSNMHPGKLLMAMRGIDKQIK